MGKHGGAKLEGHRLTSRQCIRLHDHRVNAIVCSSWRAILIGSRQHSSGSQSLEELGYVVVTVSVDRQAAVVARSISFVGKTTSKSRSSENLPCSRSLSISIARRPIANVGT
jgi:hypothetical protein